MKRIIFLDLDGTLLTTDKQILEESKEAIKRAKEANIEVAICSGRQLNSVKRYKDDACSGRYIICANGAEIIDVENNNVLSVIEIPEEVVYYLYEIVKREEAVIRVDTKYGRYISDIGYGLLEELSLDKLDRNIVDENILQISIGATEESKIDRIIEEVKKVPGIKVENKFCVDLYKEKEPLWIINIINNAASKGNAINGLCRFLKINIEDAVCFGDDLNDISMFNTVGYPIAMGNAHEVIKEKAKEIIGNNDEPSIAKKIDEIIEENRM